MSVPVEKLLCETRRVVTALAEAADASLAEIGVTPRERKVLEVLDRSRNHGMTHAEIARVLLVPVAEVDQTVRLLERHAWIAVDEGRGEPQLSLNHEGRQRSQALFAREQSVLHAMERLLDEHTVRSALRTLRAVRRGLERCPAPLDDVTSRLLGGVTAG
jgi:hypothetical protein